ncbi:GC-rich sequence DNA-binding factor-like protein-domain-containing protein [Mycotypha africana]|uniref:GC-rich sequence DNA-binding factor-like protein-domain-containing protein n=1 Tax=Mycotypha africana TaxID=64632 RepID=UPI0023001FC6|nr:GC-rich sequence DNA-binding factor-like protein-domain-containing protein [Mycotypha africana]KAI8969150.1 GC-rich sequence DNA-binding factor-like protein-domain-containing protein [Mycotypha africana]
MDDGDSSSDEEGGRIQFDVTEDDLEAEMAGFAGRQFQGQRKNNRSWNDDDDDEEEEELRGGLGMRGGLGLKVGPTFKKAATQTQTPTTEPSTPEMPSRTASPKRDSMKNKVRNGRSATSSPHSTADLGTYSSISLKMLEKMGWKRGQGLGAEGTGITAPIEVKQRPKGMGLSFRGFDERTEQAKIESEERKPQLLDEDEEIDDGDTGADELNRMKKRYAWKEEANKRTRKAKTVYKTAADILTETEGLLPTISTTTHQKVIDMRGPNIREISISDIKLTGSPTLMETTTRLPELRHNLQLIVDLSRADLENLSREKQANQLKKTSLEEELKTIEKELDTQQQQLKKIQQLKQISINLDKISKTALGTGAYETGNITALFGEQFAILEREFSDNIETMNVDALVISVWAPILKYKSITWNVIEEPTWGLADVKRWRSLLRCNDDFSTTPRNIPATISICTPFETMMNTIWLTKVRSAINNQWNVHDPEPIIQLLEEWEPVLPRFIFENIVNQLILPKIQRAVSDWNPRTDRVMIHTWLHPWFPTLKAWRLADLCTTIRQKLSVVLRQWHPSDESALHIISPWKEVWTPQQFEQFVNKSILPKLTNVLHDEFRVNPKSQDLEPLIWCLAWKGVVSDTIIGMLLKNEFFNKWHDVLVQWLSLDIYSINYDQISEWYRWWRQVFSAYDFDSNTLVMKEFRRGLDTMNKALSGGSL